MRAAEISMHTTGGAMQKQECQRQMSFIGCLYAVAVSPEGRMSVQMQRMQHMGQQRDEGEGGGET